MFKCLGGQKLTFTGTQFKKPPPKFNQDCVTVQPTQITFTPVLAFTTLQPRRMNSCTSASIGEITTNQWTVRGYRLEFRYQLQQTHRPQTVEGRDFAGPEVSEDETGFYSRLFIVWSNVHSDQPPTFEYVSGSQTFKMWKVHL